MANNPATAQARGSLNRRRKDPSAVRAPTARAFLIRTPLRILQAARLYLCHVTTSNKKAAERGRREPSARMLDGEEKKLQVWRPRAASSHRRAISCCGAYACQTL